MTLLQSSTSAVTENAVLILRILTTHSPKVALLVRETALTSGILLNHFYHATFSPGEGQRFLSRYLCSLWMSGPNCPEKQLLKRMIPAGFFPYLSMPMLSAEEEEQLDSIEKGEVGLTDKIHKISGGAGTNVDRLKSRLKIADSSSNEATDRPRQVDNFRIFFHVLSQDHSLPDLIWNQNTRRDLQVALELELRSIEQEVEARRGIYNIAWNHEQFSVMYPSLEEEVRVGSIYMRLWLQASDSFIKTWDNPVRLFELLFRRLLCDLDRNVLVSLSIYVTFTLSLCSELTPTFLSHILMQVANMCIRCLERLYSIHAAKIGPFADVTILLRYMRTTSNVETRHRLLSLVAVVMGNNYEKYEAINVRENLEQLLDAESIYHFCQLAAECHLDGSTSAVASVLQHSGAKLNLLEGSDNSSSGKPMQPMVPAVWYVAPTGQIPPLIDTVQGPYTIIDLKDLIAKEKVHRLSLVSALHVEEYNTEGQVAGVIRDSGIDTGKWMPLENVWQLRRQLFDDVSASRVFSSTKVSLLALDCLTRLVLVHKSTDSRGIPFFPIPIAKRIICEGTNSSLVSRDLRTGFVSDFHNDALAIICQGLLGSAQIVDSTANLVRLLMLQNEKNCSKLYLTGVFFFACAYSGSNWRSLAELLHETHLKQHFLAGVAATGDKNDLPVRDRSILGNMIPEGLLKILVNHGADKFAEVFVGNHDTPEGKLSCSLIKNNARYKCTCTHFVPPAKSHLVIGYEKSPCFHGTAALR